MSSPDQIAATLDALANAWSTHDVDQLLACFADDVVYEDVAAGFALHGHDEVRAWAAQLFAGIPDFEYEETHRVIGDDGAVVEYWLRGTPQIGMDGEPTSGRRGEVRCATVFALRDAKIVRNSDYWDSTTLAAQIAADG